MSVTNRKKLLITESMSPQGWAIFNARDDLDIVGFSNLISSGDFNALLQQHAPVHGVALGPTRFGPTEIRSAQDIRVVARIGVGYDAIDVPALTDIKVPLMTAGTANSPSVAEQALYMMLALAKRGQELHQLVIRDEWTTRLGRLPFDLFEKRVLIIGFGRIGTRMAKRCLAFDMQVMVYDPYKPDADIQAAGCEPVKDLDQAIPHADFITLHCPKTPETTGLFDALRIRRMKPAAYLINTARGGIVVEEALFAALNDGVLAGAGLDVFEQEPPKADLPLYHLPNVITAPHVAGVTREALNRMGEQTAINILSALDGAPVRDNVVNGEILTP